MCLKWVHERDVADMVGDKPFPSTQSGHDLALHFTI